MPDLNPGLYLNKYVDPQLLVERRNYKADFMRVIPGVPQGAITADGIRRNKLINNVGFRVNNTQEFTPKAMNGENLIIPWEKYDTEPTSCTDEEMRALSFDKRSAIRQKHNESFQIGIRNHILWKLAPTDNSKEEMPIFQTTGANDGSGRRRMCWVDLVNLSKWNLEQNFQMENQMYITLSAMHWADLILDKDASSYFKDRTTFIDPSTGMTKPFMGLQFFQNNDTPYYDLTEKEILEEGGTPVGGTHERATTLFYAPNTYYHLNSVKSLYKPETTDTRSASPTSEYRTQTYGICSRIEEYGCAAILSGKTS